jgi:hypothetical protein
MVLLAYTVMFNVQWSLQISLGSSLAKFAFKFVTSSPRPPRSETRDNWPSVANLQFAFNLMRFSSVFFALMQLSVCEFRNICIKKKKKKHIEKI